jgi:hypothetical protein
MSRSYMRYRELQPARTMRPFVLSYWHFRVFPGAGEVLHRVPLTGAAMLSVFERAKMVSLTGPRCQPLQFLLNGGDEFFGVHFRPGATGALLGVQGSALRDVQVAAADVLGARWPADLLASLRAFETSGMRRPYSIVRFVSCSREPPVSMAP